MPFDLVSLWTTATVLLAVAVEAATPTPPPEPTRPRLRDEIRRMVEEDQRLRKAIIADPGNADLSKQLNGIDRRYLKRMKAIVRTYGWPTQSMVGVDGMEGAWLLVQHADHDPAFQRHCLEMMAPLLEKDEVQPLEVAYPIDRVLVNEGKKQIYGTQCITNDSGDFAPRPIEDEPNVDARRKTMGLSTLAEYLEEMRKVYPKK